MGVSGSYYGRLLLENKILVIFALLLAFLGATLHTAQHRATVQVAEELVIEGLDAGLADQLDSLSRAAEGRELETLSAILHRVAEQDPRIISLLVADTSGRPLVGLLDWRVFFEDGLEKIMDKPITWGRVRRTRGFPPRESVLRRRDGSLIAVRLAGISLFERGRRIGRVFYFQDMREIKHLREELIRSERLAATGQAAAWARPGQSHTQASCSAPAPAGWSRRPRQDR
jgi:hypothetical protein